MNKTMDEYNYLKQKVLSKIKCKTKETSYGFTKIIAYYCETPEQLFLAINFEECCVSSKYRRVHDVYDKTFKGADWYFFNCEQISDGHYTEYEYKVETLTEKKIAFQKFVDEFTF